MKTRGGGNCFGAVHTWPEVGHLRIYRTVKLQGKTDQKGGEPGGPMPR